MPNKFLAHFTHKVKKKLCFLQGINWLAQGSFSEMFWTSLWGFVRLLCDRRPGKRDELSTAREHCLVSYDSVRVCANMLPAMFVYNWWPVQSLGVMSFSRCQIKKNGRLNYFTWTVSSDRGLMFGSQMIQKIHIKAHGGTSDISPVWFWERTTTWAIV